MCRHHWHHVDSSEKKVKTTKVTRCPVVGDNHMEIQYNEWCCSCKKTRTKKVLIHVTKDNMYHMIAFLMDASRAYLYK